MGAFEKHVLSWAIGTAKNFAKAKNVVGSYGQLRKLLSKPHVTPEKRKAFDKMSKAEQDNLKSIAGWISGAQCSGAWRNKKNILPRDLATIDIDYAEPSLAGMVEVGLTGISQYLFLCHSSRRHTPEAPRLRFFIPLSRKVSVDEYIAIIRYIGFLLDPDMKLVDPVSYRPAQMMFLPTCSKDDEPDFFFHDNDGELFDVDEALDAIDERFGDWRDLNLLPKSPSEDNLRKRADKAEDPLEKRGPVGDFCRAYDIETAMEKFLPGVYLSGDEYFGHPRYTYAGSTSSNGAVVYDNGRFMYSHHGTDPICDMNVNAFDLVRIHKFGDLDEKAKEDAGPKDKPSYKAMIEHIADDKEYKQAQADSRYDMAAILDDAGITKLEDDEADEPAGEEPDDPYDLAEDLVGSRSGKPKREKPKPAKRKFHKPEPDWFPAALELNQNGDIVPTLHNVATIIQNDPRFCGKIAFNDFAKQIVAVGNIKSSMKTVPPYDCRDAENGDRWQTFNDVSIRAVLEAPNGVGKAGYGLKVSDRDLAGAVELAARRNLFHPVREYLTSTVWDGVSRIETLFPRYLGSPDTPYHRETAKLMMVAAVARAFEPGHKFDYAVILGGKQGLGKSSFIKELHGGEKWFGELNCNLDDTQAVAEAISGKWVMELPELSALSKSDSNAAKAFMRRQYDDVRMAYDRRVTEFPRQCVFWGSTNDRIYLKDPTGNRSYWPVEVQRLNEIDLVALKEERDQLWAETYAIYREMRANTPPDRDLFLSLSNKDSIREANERQEAARTTEMFEQIREELEVWLDTELPLNQLLAEYGAGSVEFPDVDAESDETIRVMRTAFRVCDAQQAVFGSVGRGLTNGQLQQHVQKALSHLTGWEKEENTRRVFKTNGRWYTRIDQINAERAKGFSIVENEDLSQDIPDII